MTSSSIIIIVLALCGLGTCYPFFRGTMELVCADGSCVKLSRTPYYRMFGVPNWWLGIALYLLMIVAALTHIRLLEYASLFGAVCAVLMAFPLIYSLVKILKTVCVACYLAHATNLLLLVAWIVFVRS